MQPINSTLPANATLAQTNSPQNTTTLHRPANNSDSAENSPAKPVTLDRPSVQQLEEAALRIEKFVQPINSDLQFTIDESTGTSVVKVIDRNTKELIRQMPSEEMLAIAGSLDRLQGLLVKQRA